MDSTRPVLNEPHNPPPSNWTPDDQDMGPPRVKAESAAAAGPPDLHDENHSHAGQVPESTPDYPRSSSVGEPTNGTTDSKGDPVLREKQPKVPRSLLCLLLVTAR